MCWSCGAESGFFGRSKFVLKQKKTFVFFLYVKGNDTGMELLLISLKSQQSNTNKFSKLIRMPFLFFKVKFTHASKSSKMLVQEWMSEN